MRQVNGDDLGIWQHVAQQVSGGPGFRGPRGDPADRLRCARDFRPGAQGKLRNPRAFGRQDVRPAPIRA